MKPKCPKCGKPALVATGGFDDPMKPHRFCVYCHKCGWTRRVPPSAIVRLAMKKRETCKWEHSEEGDFISPHAAYMPSFPFCPHCGKPVEVVNG